MEMASALVSHSQLAKCRDCTNNLRPDGSGGVVGANARLHLFDPGSIHRAHSSCDKLFLYPKRCSQDEQRREEPPRSEVLHRER